MFVGSIGFLTFLAAAALTALMRKFALARGIIDHPNARSSHQRPTPRGGGLAIVLAVSAASMLLWLHGVMHARVLVTLLLGGGAVALVGFFDDRGSLPVRIRIAIHFCAAVFAVSMLGGAPRILWGSRLLDLGPGGDAVEVIVIVWLLNLFNFMDGIDGIAASEVAFITAAGALLACVAGLPTTEVSPPLMVAAASLGFLVWNWPPARIFMGDVGSGYLGYVAGVLMLVSAHAQPVMLYAWLILSGVFVVDSTATLLRRLIRGERVYHAHRSHAYQWLARKWGSHRSVTVAVISVNLLWLLPCAFFAVSYPARAAWIALLALAPLTVLIIAAGAGRREVV